MQFNSDIDGVAGWPLLALQSQCLYYFGSTITEIGKCDDDIKKGIGIAKEAFQKLGNILKNSKLSIGTRKRVLDCNVKSILLYGSECWTLSSEMEQRLEATEMWFYRQMLKISWTERATNEEVLRRMQTD